MKEFMRRTGVTKKKYVEKWIEEGLIPGVTADPVTGEYIIPPYARRPYRPRYKPNADATTIRTSMLNGCLKRQHISPEIYDMKPLEFFGYINDLKALGLIREWESDGVTYYDTTAKCDEMKDTSLRKLRKFVLDALREISEGVAFAVMKSLPELLKSE